MVNPFRKDPESDQPPFSNEEIEAAYFPGAVPVFPDPTPDCLDSLRFTDEGWESAATGIIFVIAGKAERPDAIKLELAKAIIAQFPKVEADAKHVAHVFIRDEGSWSVEEVNLGRSALENQCDFQVRLTFSPTDGSERYGYTSFTVCFIASSSSKSVTFHPRKHVIEFL